MSAGATVLSIGAGGLGSAALPLLATSPDVARLILVDDDRVDDTNLHRQTLYGSEDVGRLKTEIAKARLVERSRVERDEPVEVETVNARFVPSTAEELLRDVDLVIEGADNLATKFLVADATRAHRVPVVQAGAVRWYGWALLAMADRGPCVRCVFEDVPTDRMETCAEAGVVGPVVGVLGALEAALAIRLLLGDESAAGELWSYDGLAGRLRRSRVRQRSGCPACSGEIIDLRPERYAAPCAARAGSPPHDRSGV